jgi:predicted Zn-dependent protease
MGHVIGRHHNEHTATRIIVSVLAQVLLPMSGIIRSLSLLPGASSATAASFLGSRAMIARYWPKQLGEADTVALTMLARLGYDPQETVDALAATEQSLDDSSWPQDLRASSAHVAQIVQGPRPDTERLAQLAGSMPLKLTYVIGTPSAGAAELSPQARAQ